jgi:hypothetical protein
VVNGCHDVELELAIAAGLEDSSIDFDLFDTWTEELLQRGDNPGLFASAGWAVDE